VQIDRSLLRVLGAARQTLEVSVRAWDFLMPVAFRRPGFVARLTQSGQPAAEEPLAAGTVLLESDVDAVAAFVVENERPEPVTAELSISPFTDANGTVAAIDVEMSPRSVVLGPGESAVVRVAAHLGSTLVAERQYRAEISLPGLGGATVPIAARRLEPTAA
jgi:hypothetical protein